MREHYAAANDCQGWNSESHRARSECPTVEQAKEAKKAAKTAANEESAREKGRAKAEKRAKKKGQFGGVDNMSPTARTFEIEEDFSNLLAGGQSPVALAAWADLGDDEDET